MVKLPHSLMKGGSPMETFQVLTLMLAFGMFIIALLNYLKKSK
ncbi:putative holin-like toxin [Paenibacillus tianmuensis]